MPLLNNNLLLFVYGTLRQGCPTGAHQQYLQGAEFISPAKVRGRLFLIDYYPGLFISDTQKSDGIHNGTNGESWISGEIYRLKNQNQLQHLDNYEGCASDSPKPHEYTRTLVNALLPNGNTLAVWTYVSNGDTSNLVRITSGDFLKP